MGHPVEPFDDEYEEGDECTACHNVIFNGRTPRIMKALFSEIKPCGEAPPTGDIPPVYLIQDSEVPCNWAGWDKIGNWFADYHCNWDNRFSFLQLWGPGGDTFFGWIEELCQTSFSNTFLCSESDNYEDGSGCVRWGLKVDEEHYETW